MTIYKHTERKNKYMYRNKYMCRNKICFVTFCESFLILSK